MAAQNLPENLRKPVQCIAESQGDPFGAGVCMASDGLTSDQRIGLECLVSAGGNPIPFATCAGGRLAVKELFNCVDKKFFEGNCMGSGNEFVKVATALRIDLRPETVVGQVLNYQLDVVKFQVRLAEAASKGVLEVGDKFVHVTNDAAVAVATAVADTKNAVFQGVDDGKTAVVKGVDDGKTAVVKGLDDGKNAVKRWLGL